MLSSARLGPPAPIVAFCRRIVTAALRDPAPDLHNLIFGDTTRGLDR